MTRLAVAVDARMLQAEPLGGVARVMAGLLPALSEHVDLHLLLDARRPAPQDTVAPAATCVSLGAPRGVPGIGWLEVAVAPWLRRFTGVFHGIFNMVPLSSRVPAVVTVHDLAPQRHPDDFGAATRAAWRLWMRGSVRRARAILTVSDFVRDEIVDHFRAGRSRVFVARNAVDPVFSPDRARDAPGVLGSLGIAGPYVVAIGGAPRRGLPAAIAAWRHARALGAGVQLAVLGGEALAPEPGLLALGRLDDRAWAAVLAGARGLCYPTSYEGFGLPALEAAASGTPVVCNRVASLPEVLGDAACWAADRSPQALGTLIARLAGDDAFRAERSAAVLEQAARWPTWSDAAEVVLHAYEQAARS